MAPSPTHLHKMLVRNYKLLKAVWNSATRTIQARIPVAQLEPIPVRVGQPLHPIAALKQSRARFSSSYRQFSTSASRAAKQTTTKSKSAWPASFTRTAVTALPGRAPFATTLRPNLTGGALPRTAGGYGLGSGRVGGQRYFSHGPAAPAQVIQSVSQAVRAFLIGGQKAQFDGVDSRTGSKRYRAVTTLQDSATRKIRSLPQATPGSFVDFSVNPTITALTPLSAVAGYAGFTSSGLEDTVNVSRQNELAHLNASGLLDVLSADFSRALQDLAAILMDLKALSALGDLPITYRTEKGTSILRVHFPGCDADTVERLMSELNVKRGLVYQDEDFDAFTGTEMALLFPFAPSNAGSDVSEQVETWSQNKPNPYWQRQSINLEMEADELNEEYSTRSDSGLELIDPYDEHDGVLLTNCDGTEVSLSSHSPSRSSHRHRYEGSTPSHASGPLEYQDFEGIYRFIELCDSARR